jgi:hypothetical protein
MGYPGSRDRGESAALSRARVRKRKHRKTTGYPPLLSLELFSPARHRAQTERRRACNVPVCPRATDSYPAYSTGLYTPRAHTRPAHRYRTRVPAFCYDVRNRRPSAPHCLSRSPAPDHLCYFELAILSVIHAPVYLKAQALEPSLASPSLSRPALFSRAVRKTCHVSQPHAWPVLMQHYAVRPQLAIGLPHKA